MQNSAYQVMAKSSYHAQIGEKLCGMAMQGDLKALNLLMELAGLKAGEKAENQAKTAPQTVIIQDYPV